MPPSLRPARAPRFEFASGINLFTVALITTDAANLSIPVFGLFPPDDPRGQDAIDQTLEQLTANQRVCRDRAGDSRPSYEGALAWCTFWLVDALTLCGRVADARELFTAMAERVNHVGLYTEEIDPFRGELQSNVPQPVTNTGLISSVLLLACVEGRLPSFDLQPRGTE